VRKLAQAGWRIKVWTNSGGNPEPAWGTLQMLRQAAAHGTLARWNNGCSCVLCRRAHSDDQRTRGRARAQKRLSVQLRQQLLNAIYAGQPFRAVLGDLGLTSNQVWGLTKTEQEWSAALEAALTAARRGDLRHGTNAAYVHGCVCSECREHQRVRMAKTAASSRHLVSSRYS
jgi:hypothetical protein